MISLGKTVMHHVYWKISSTSWDKCHCLPNSENSDLNRDLHGTEPLVDNIEHLTKKDHNLLVAGRIVVPKWRL
jgi:hypothetical protein